MVAATSSPRSTAASTSSTGWRRPPRPRPAKVETIVVGVGYPERWRDYSTLVVRRDDAFGNACAPSASNIATSSPSSARPVDRSEWWMTPQTVNAVNLPLQNALNFPAAILQPPFFDPKRRPAANYGAIGAMIGHEISHSFDDQGAQFDAQGRLRDWWTTEDLEHFHGGRALVAQYNAYSRSRTWRSTAS